MRTEKKFLTIWLIILLLGFPQISETIYTPSLPSLGKSLQASPSMLELTLSIYFVGFALGVCLWGILSDWFGRRKTMLMGLCFYLIGCLACQTSISVDQLLLWRVIQAFGASVGSVVTLTMIRDLYSLKERQAIFALVGMSLSASPALGPLIGGLLDQFFGWRSNFSVLLILGSSLLIYCWFRLPETKPLHTEKRTISGLGVLALKMLQDPFIIVNAAIVGLGNGIIFSYYGEAPFVFIEILHLTPSQYGLLGMIVAAAGITAGYSSKYLTAKLISEKVLAIGACASCIGSLFFILVSVTAALSILSASVSVFVLMYGVSLMLPNSLNIALKNYGSCLGSAGSIFGVFYYVLTSLATALMSLFHNGSIVVMPLYFLALSLLLIALSYSLVARAATTVTQNETRSN